MSDRRFTGDEAERELGLKPGTVKVWRARGRVVPVGYIPGRGQKAPVYLLDELQPLAEQWHRRAATRRQKAACLPSAAP